MKGPRPTHPMLRTPGAYLLLKAKQFKELVSLAGVPLGAIEAPPSGRKVRKDAPRSADSRNRHAAWQCMCDLIESERTPGTQRYKLAEWHHTRRGLRPMKRPSI